MIDKLHNRGRELTTSVNDNLTSTLPASMINTVYAPDVDANMFHDLRQSPLITLDLIGWDLDREEGIVASYEVAVWSTFPETYSQLVDCVLTAIKHGGAHPKSCEVDRNVRLQDPTLRHVNVLCEAIVA